MIPDGRLAMQGKINSAKSGNYVRRLHKHRLCYTIYFEEFENIRRREIYEKKYTYVELVEVRGVKVLEGPCIFLEEVGLEKDTSLLFRTVLLIVKN